MVRFVLGATPISLPKEMPPSKAKYLLCSSLCSRTQLPNANTVCHKT